MCPDSLLILAPYKSFAHLLTYTFFLNLFTSLRIGTFHLQAGGHKKRPNLVLIFECLFCVVVYIVMDARLLLLRLI